MLPSTVSEKEEQMSRPKTKPQLVHVVGPLAPYAAEFESRLTDAGFTPLTRAAELRVMLHLSRWLQTRRVRVGELSWAVIDEYLGERRAAGYASFCSRGSIAPLLWTLTGAGLLPAEPQPTLGSPVEVLLAGFARYLREERGLAECTTAAHVARARRFLTDYVDGDGDGGQGLMRDLCAGDVTRAVLAEAGRLSVGSAQYFVAALRAFLRYCFLSGLVDTDLSASALPVTGRRRSTLPRGISAAQATALLRSCDRRTSAGRRDYAVIVLLLRLGLRAGEVAALCLEDIDWRAGQITVHGKGGRVDRLPLPTEVGEAIAGYLRRGRPRSGAGVRAVFVRTTAPRTALTRGGVSFIVRRASVRAGLTPFGAHRLRHTAATEMLRAGATLSEIGQVLRHRSGTSTATYARVDIERLRTVARPWPDGAVR
jgi:integrase/recombinase XerD